MIRLLFILALLGIPVLAQPVAPSAAAIADAPIILVPLPLSEAPPLPVALPGATSIIGTTISGSLPAKPVRDASLAAHTELLARLPASIGTGFTQVKETSKEQTVPEGVFAYGERVFLGPDRRTLIVRLSHVPGPALFAARAGALAQADWQPEAPAAPGKSEKLINLLGQTAYQKEVVTSGKPMSQLRLARDRELLEWWGLQTPATELITIAEKNGWPGAE